MTHSIQNRAVSMNANIGDKCIFGRGIETRVFLSISVSFLYLQTLIHYPGVLVPYVFITSFLMVRHDYPDIEIGLVW